ncbi:MAG: TAXI family TRAP transporter solute-binding subunit [Actinomycetota bacterium]
MIRDLRFKSLVLMAAFAIVVAACGSSDDETETADTASEEATTEEATSDTAESAGETTETTEAAEAAEPAPAEGGDVSLIISTASTGGTYYPVGVALSTLTNVNLANDGIQMNAISSAGSGENVQLLKNREVDLAILQGLFGSMAWEGKGNYEGAPEQTMRSVTMLWENVEHFTVDSEYATTGNISDLDNLKGQAFSIGRRGSGTETSGTVILNALGYDVDGDFKPERVGYSESSAALQDGRIAGMNTPAGPPVSAVTQAFATMGGDITMLQFTDEQIETVNADFPVWSRFVIPAGTYPGVEEDINTISQPKFLAVHPDLDDETVYQITKNIYENLDFLVNIHQATGAMNLERATVGLPVPLHPGAIRYYEEVGLEIPDELRP